MQLVVNSRGASLRKVGDRFSVQAGERKFAVSAHKVQSILVTTAVLFSTDAIELAVAHNIDVVFLDRHGDPYGRLWQSRMGSTATIRRRQLEVAEGPEGLAFVCGWVRAKLRHQMEFLEELRHRRPTTDHVFESPLATLRGCLARLDGLSGALDEQRGTIMGLEGTAGRVYFACLAELVPQNFRFDGRSRQPARDEFNALLNYAYGVLYSLVEKACICAGLDPYVGFLHADNYNKKSLVFDLIEPFRILGDRAVVLLFTGRRVQKDYFEPVPGGVALNREGRAFFIEHFNERLLTRHWLVGRPMGKQDRTLQAIFETPTRANIDWRDIEALLKHMGATIIEGRGSRVRVVLREFKATFHRPHPQKEASKGCLESVRELLDSAGIGP